MISSRDLYAEYERIIPKCDRSNKVEELNVLLDSDISQELEQIRFNRVHILQRRSS